MGHPVLQWAAFVHLRPAVVGVAPLESVRGLDEVVLGHGVLELPHPNPSFTACADVQGWLRKLRTQ